MNLNTKGKVLTPEFFARDCLEAAPELVGKLLAVETEDGVKALRITETEAYRGEEDTACHAHIGRTPRNEVLYMRPGTVYVYLCYGIHWLLNFITAEENVPQGVLIRACEGYEGPGKLTKALGITGAFNRAYLGECGLYIIDDGLRPEITTMPRVGIAYASPVDREKPWRFVMKSSDSPLNSKGRSPR